MRIIIANDNATVTGGATKCAVLSAKGLAELGYDVHYLFGGGKIDPEYLGIPNLTFHDLQNPEVPMSAKRLIQLSYLQSTYDALSKLIAQGDPKNTIVHLHLWKVQLSPSVVNATLDAGAHLIVSFHDYHLACPQGQFFNNKTQSICTLKPGGVQCLTTHCTKSRTMLGKWAEVYRWSVQKGKGGIPTRVKNFGVFSQKSVDVYKPFLPEGAQLHMMHYPIQAVQAPRVEAEKNTRFVFSGRLSYEKDPKILVHAAAKIGAEVRFLGDGPLKQAVEDLGYEKASFAGWLNGDQVLEEMKLARVMAITSIWYEVNPLAPIEALGRGIPVIASDCTSTVNEIIDGETGFPFKQQNAADLAEKMALLLEDDRVERMSKAAYERFWIKPPTPENHVKRLLEIYESMLA